MSGSPLADAHNMTNSQKWYRNVYLHSDHWLDLRAEKLALNTFCEQCGGAGPYDVHHRRYRNIFDCSVGDLVTLCRKCHKAEHAVLSAANSNAIRRASLEIPRFTSNEKWKEARLKAGKTAWSAMTGNKPEAVALRKAHEERLKTKAIEEKKARKMLLPKGQNRSFREHLKELGIQDQIVA